MSRLPSILKKQNIKKKTKFPFSVLAVDSFSGIRNKVKSDFKEEKKRKEGFMKDLRDILAIIFTVIGIVYFAGSKVTGIENGVKRNTEISAGIEKQVGEIAKMQKNNQKMMQHLLIKQATAESDIKNIKKDIDSISVRRLKKRR